MSNADEPSAGGLLWQQARERYEDPAQNLEAIAESLNVSRFRLVQEACKRGWKLRRARSSTGTRATIQRFKDLLHRRLGQLESQIGEIGDDISAANSEREIRATNTLVRTLEKVLELERKDRAHRARKRHERRSFDDAAREELARRISGLRREGGGQADQPEPSAGERAGPEPGLAQLGQARPADSA